ncbi:MAG TPA: GspH/FimT family pseudopilin [Vicinamibacterales bacterium]
MSRAAYSVLELLICLSLALVFCSASAPVLLAARDGIRADGAADYLVSQIHGARMEALKRHAHVAVRFEPDGDDYLLAFYADGNANGVRASDIASGVDVLLRPREPLRQQFTGVRFGFEDGVPDVDGTGTLEDRDPIRVGRSRLLSFSPTGTSSTGTVYLHGRGRRQLAVRVLGVTGRIRSLSFDFGTGTWRPR